MLRVGLGMLLLIASSGCATPGKQVTATMEPVSPESQLAIPDLTTLVREADLTIVGRVLAPGTTRQVPQPLQTPIGPTRAAPTQAPSGRISVPVTTYTVGVERTVRGSAASGAQITVLQSGSPIRGAPPSQEDPGLTAGERYVFFLDRVDGGAFSIVGGPQGRLLLDAQNRVHPTNAASIATRSHDGQALEAFLAEVSAVQ